MFGRMVDCRLSQKESARSAENPPSDQWTSRFCTLICLVASEKRGSGVAVLLPKTCPATYSPNTGPCFEPMAGSSTDQPGIRASTCSSHEHPSSRTDREEFAIHPQPLGCDLRTHAGDKQNGRRPEGKRRRLGQGAGGLPCLRSQGASTAEGVGRALPPVGIWSVSNYNSKRRPAGSQSLVANAGPIFESVWRRCLLCRMLQ
jgi:hypothetical protein